MRRVAAPGLLLVALCLLAPAMAARAQDTFQDVPRSSWTYGAMADLQQDGLLSGYPAGYFGGARLLSRYEFSVALRRALDAVPAAEAGSDSGASVRLDQSAIDHLNRLSAFFAHDLSVLKLDTPQVSALLARLAAKEPRLPAASTVLPASTRPTVPVTPLAARLVASLQASSQIALTPPQPGGDAASSLLLTQAAPGLTLPGSGAGLTSDAGGHAFRFEQRLFHSAGLGVSLENLRLGLSPDPAPASMLVYGADLSVRPVPRFALGAAVARSLDISGDPGSPLNGDAYRLNLAYASGPASAEVGYQFVNPLTPDPSLVGLTLQGPFTRFSYKFSNSVRSYIGADFLSAAQPSSGDALSTPFGVSNVYRGSAGVRWRLLPGVNLSADYEGVLYDLSGDFQPGLRHAGPIEQYLTIGAGLNLTRNAILRMAYQITNQPDGGVEALNGAQQRTGSVFTTELAVHF